MPIDPGKLNKKIVIQRKGSGQDSMGAPNGTWTTHATVWAERKDRKSRQSQESEGSGKVEAVIFTDWRFYNSSETSDVASSDQITHGGKTFEILTVREIGDDVIEVTTRLRTN